MAISFATQDASCWIHNCVLFRQLAVRGRQPVCLTCFKRVEPPHKLIKALGDLGRVLADLATLLRADLRAHQLCRAVRLPVEQSADEMAHQP